MNFRWLRSRARPDTAPPPSAEPDALEHEDLEHDDLESGAPETVDLEITDTLDLHVFPPRDVKDLVHHWLDLTYEAGHREVRIIHGKGKGVQRRMVRAILERDPRVVEFGDAKDASSWGATRALLR